MNNISIRLSSYQWICLLYLGVAIFCWQLKYFRHIDNNYLIYRHSFFHARDQLNLYLDYPAEYYDVFLYGPLFTVFIAPLAMLPEAAGFFCWEILNAAALLLAIHLLPFTVKIRTAILLLCVVEFANSSHYMEINPLIAAMIILSFILVKKGKEQYATLLIIAGTFIKLYPIVGLVFFVFSANKRKFLYWSFIWAIVCFCLPILLTGPEFLLRSYQDWFQALSAKNDLNVSLTSGQDWCVMGVARRLTGVAALPNWPFLAVGVFIFALPLLRFRQYRSLRFQLQIMCSALLMVVIFSTGAEHPTFIIATAGAVIYIMMQAQPFKGVNLLLLILLIVITGLGPTDAFPTGIRKAMGNMAMKAWPCIIIWCKLAYELIFNDFRPKVVRLVAIPGNRELLIRRIRRSG